LKRKTELPHIALIRHYNAFAKLNRHPGGKRLHPPVTIRRPTRTALFLDTLAPDIPIRLNHVPEKDP
jgi:hypothetical protein